jgi:hypothetical protein
MRRAKRSIGPECLLGRHRSEIAWTLTVYAQLLGVNNRAKNGVLDNGDVTLQAEAADLFTALNQAGSIG